MGIEHTSCFARNVSGIENEITKDNNSYHKKPFSDLYNSSNKKQKNKNNNSITPLDYYHSVDKLNTSSRKYTRSNSPFNSMNNIKIIIIQKFIRLLLAKKRFKERIELLLNIIELDNPVNLIKDKNTSIKILSENKGEQLWKELVAKKKIFPYEDTPYYRKNIKYFRPGKYILSTNLIYIDKFKNNNLYKGTWTLEKIFHGFGTFYVSGNKYEGFWNFGKLNGDCRYFLQNKDYFIGNFKEGQAEGKGKYFHNDGTIYEGEWKNDQPCGQGKEIFLDGSIFEGTFENGIKTKGLFKWNDGSYYNGDIKNNLFEGYGTFHWKEGREYNGTWKGGKMWGYGVMKYLDGARYEGNFENGKRDGYGKYIWNKGKYYEGEWKKGKQNGKGFFYNKERGIHAFWKDGSIINSSSNNSRINAYNDSILSLNKSNYSGIDRIYFKLKYSHNYKNINYKLNDITKKKTKDSNSNNKSKNNINRNNISYRSNLSNRNKSNKNDSNYFNKKINYGYTDKGKNK